MLFWRAGIVDVSFPTGHLELSDHVTITSVRGVGVIELLVALTIVSIALVGGFSLFLAIQEATIRAQIQSKEVAAAGQANDKMFLAFGDNSTFFSGSFQTFQPDDNTTLGDSGNVTVTRLFGDQPYMSEEVGFSCIVDSFGTDNVTFESDCFDDPNVTVADMRAALVHENLPTLVLVEGQEACVVSSTFDNGSYLTATVRNPECLQSATGDNITANSGIMLPRLISKSDRHETVVSSVMFDYHAANRRGAGVNFGLANQFRQTDPMTFRIETAANITTSTELDTLAEGDFRYLVRVFNPLGAQDTFLRILVDNGTITMPSEVTTASSDVILDEMGPASVLDVFFDNLSIQANTEAIELRFYVASDDMMWVRTLTVDGS